MNDHIEFALSKLLSARFWMAMAFAFTACYGFLLKILTPAEFMTLAGVCVHAYFSKSESPKEINNGQVPK